jgi:polysaccharide export outer membrane protein
MGLMRKTRRGTPWIAAWIFTSLFFVWGCLGSSMRFAVAAPLPQAEAAGYQIADGDTIDISVIGKPELARTATVLPDGTIAYPYLGQIRARGLTPGQLEDRIRTGLRAQLSDPEVVVAITRRQEYEVSALGAVRTPGKRVLGEGWHVLDLLADAGGLTVERPEWAEATLVRRGGSEAVPIDIARLYAAADASQNPELAPGDVLLVQERDASKTSVQVLGAVMHPGTVLAPADGSPLTVLVLAGGPTAGAALSRAVILRGSLTLPINLAGLGDDAGAARAALPTDPALRLQPGDTLLIPQNLRVFSVIGAVSHPGTMSYPDAGSMTVLSALSLAGGGSDAADLKNVALVRANPDPGKPPIVIPVNVERLTKAGTTSDGKPAVLDIPVEPGDVVFVPSRRGRGGVNLAQAIPFLPLLTLVH